MNTLKTTFGVVALAAAAPFTQAVMIDGHIAFDGSVSLDAPIPSATAFQSFSNAKVSTGTQDGIYVGTAGTAVMMEMIKFDPFMLPAQPLWSFSKDGIDYSFNFLSLDDFEVEQLSSGLYTLTFSGTGMAMATGYEDTPGAFSISTTGNAQASDLGFSAFTFTTAGEQVPDGGSTAAMMGAGLLVLAIFGCKRLASAKA